MDKLQLHYKRIWRLQYTDECLTTKSGMLQPAIFEGRECMLKIIRREKDHRGNELMIWWNGEGAARVWMHDKTAVLMERAKAARSLAEMARTGQDSVATRILCDVTARLHKHRPPYPLSLVPLASWFKELLVAAKPFDELLTQCAKVADALLKSQQDIVALHGDVHHGNVLDFGARGWLAIDPKGLVGERGFDYANIFCNPNAGVATKPGRLIQQAVLVADAVGLDRRRLLQWVAAWAGLSAIWSIHDREDPQTAMIVAKLALAQLS